jgi:hypothetical protein
MAKTTKAEERKEKEFDKRRTPVRRGDVYCSPGCGMGCKWEKYQEAKHLAAALAKRLGKGWEPKVWENLGWHYEARLPSTGSAWHSLRVMEHLDSRYLKSDRYWCALHMYSAHAASPVAAVRAVVLAMREDKSKLEAFLEAIHASTPSACR